MHGNSKYKLTLQLADANRALEMELAREVRNEFMIEYYKRELARLTARVYR